MEGAKLGGRFESSEVRGCLDRGRCEKKVTEGLPAAAFQKLVTRVLK